MFDDLIGKPYIENGRGPNGYDCWGVVMEIGRRIGVKLPEVDVIGQQRFFKINKSETRGGDIVLIDAANGRHTGAMINRKKLMTVESTSKRGVHIINIEHPWIKSRIIGIYRYAG